MRKDQDGKSKKYTGCAHCYHGWVLHHKVDLVTGRKYDAANPCGYCWDNHSAPMMILRNGKLFWASRKLDKVETRDLANLEECPSTFVPGWQRDHIYEGAGK